MLIIDLDPQGNASTGLGIDRKSRARLDLRRADRRGRRCATRSCETAVPRLHIVPSTLDLSGLELEIGAGARPRVPAARRARGAQRRRDGGGDYTYVLIDCPPSLNLLTVNAMAAAHAILVPLQCEFFALEGLSQLLKTVEQVQDRAQSRASRSTASC